MLISAVLLLLAAVPSLAQTFTTTTADVILQGCGARPTNVKLVLKGDEGTWSDLTYVGSDHWSAINLPKLNAHGTKASLRLGGSRTKCATSTEERDPHDDDNWIALFKFHCTQERFWSRLSVETTPSTLPMQYTRVMPDDRKMPDGRVMVDLGCVEHRYEITGTADIVDLAADNELIFVNLGKDVPPEYTDFSVFIEHGVFGGKTLRRKPLEFSSGDVLTELTLRRDHKHNAQPTASDNMRSIRGRDALPPFDKITMTVK
jgi:hypothetical protein